MGAALPAFALCVGLGWALGGVGVLRSLGPVKGDPGLSPNLSAGFSQPPGGLSKTHGALTRAARPDRRAAADQAGTKFGNCFGWASAVAGCRVPQASVTFAPG